jgi:hypothetical protein
MDDEELEERLREMDGKLDRIRNNTNVLSTIRKENSREDLQKLFMRKLGRNNDMKKAWLAADEQEWKTNEELREISDVNNIGRATKKLHDKSMMDRREEENRMLYRKSEATVGINLEGKIKSDLND